MTDELGLIKSLELLGQREALEITLPTFSPYPHLTQGGSSL